MMTNLYLDTARFGLMGPSVCQAQIDFLRFCAEEGASACAEDFLLHGPGAWPAPLRYRYPGLAAWQGVASLKESLRRLVGAPADTPLFLANRSAQLMKLAARALFRRCQSVLHTDLEWPGYLAALEAERKRGPGRLVCFPARDAILRQGLGVAEFTRSLTVHYRREQCQGLFLSAVSFDGLRLPVTEIVAALSKGRPPHFIVVDGAQALAHLPAGLPTCDVYLSGCHKWLGAGTPMGLAFQPRRSSHGFLRTLAHEMTAKGELDDALLLFTNQLEAGRLERFTETVGVAGLFACAAAVGANLARPNQTCSSQFLERRANADAATEVARRSGWNPLLPDTSFRSGILLVQAHAPETRAAPAQELRTRFQGHGVAVTTYADGLARVSLLAQPLRGRQVDRLRSALSLCA
jgi:hypothetical protein